MNRTPPIAVRKQLRKEVGFGCPIESCNSPYLEWHHFDPPWREKKHHESAGMIALCRMHHAQADGGAYTKEQLRKYKEEAVIKAAKIQGKFGWMRNKLLAIVGGNFFYEVPIIFQYRGKDVIWFRRDENNYFLLNIDMLADGSTQKLKIEDNFWMSEGEPQDLLCPPSGKKLEVRYEDGDYIKIEFYELNSINGLQNKFPAFSFENSIVFPITAVEVNYNYVDGKVNFTPSATNIQGIYLHNCFMSGCSVAIDFNEERALICKGS